jgi:hypothetical protein
MIRQDFSINGYWDVTVFYNVRTPELNQGFTQTDTRLRKSIIVIGCTDSVEQFYNTIVHEAKHLQSSICRHYDVDEDSEDAAYLIGYIVMRMVRFLNNF